MKLIIKIEICYKILALKNGVNNTYVSLKEIALDYDQKEKKTFSDISTMLSYFKLHVIIMHKWSALQHTSLGYGLRCIYCPFT